jgi:hypothetical protein
MARQAVRARCGRQGKAGRGKAGPYCVRQAAKEKLRHAGRTI